MKGLLTTIILIVILALVFAIGRITAPFVVETYEPIYAEGYGSSMQYRFNTDGTVRGWFDPYSKVGYDLKWGYYVSEDCNVPTQFTTENEYRISIGPLDVVRSINKMLKEAAN